MQDQTLKQISFSFICSFSFRSFLLFLLWDIFYSAPDLILRVSLSSACNVLYLNSVETESLTGPQAVAKATGVMMSLSPRPSATVVHFKVSTQGITLTDSQRRYASYCTVTTHLHLSLTSPLTNFDITLLHAHAVNIYILLYIVDSFPLFGDLFLTDWCRFPACSSGDTTLSTAWLSAARIHRTEGESMLNTLLTNSPTSLSREIFRTVVKSVLCDKCP